MRLQESYTLIGRIFQGHVKAKLIMYADIMLHTLNVKANNARFPFVNFTEMALPSQTIRAEAWQAEAATGELHSDVVPQELD